MSVADPSTTVANDPVGGSSCSAYSTRGSAPNRATAARSSPPRASSAVRTQSSATRAPTPTESDASTRNATSMSVPRVVSRGAASASTSSPTAAARTTVAARCRPGPRRWAQAHSSTASTSTASRTWRPSGWRPSAGTGPSASAPVPPVAVVASGPGRARSPSPGTGLTAMAGGPAGRSPSPCWSIRHSPTSSTVSRGEAGSTTCVRPDGEVTSAPVAPSTIGTVTVLPACAGSVAGGPASQAMVLATSTGQLASRGRFEASRSNPTATTGVPSSRPASSRSPEGPPASGVSAVDCSGVASATATPDRSTEAVSSWSLAWWVIVGWSTAAPASIPSGHDVGPTSRVGTSRVSGAATRSTTSRSTSPRSSGTASDSSTVTPATDSSAVRRNTLPGVASATWTSRGADSRAKAWSSTVRASCRRSAAASSATGDTRAPSTSPSPPETVRTRSSLARGGIRKRSLTTSVPSTLSVSWARAACCPWLRTCTNTCDDPAPTGTACRRVMPRLGRASPTAVTRSPGGTSSRCSAGTAPSVSRCSTVSWPGRCSAAASVNASPRSAGPCPTRTPRTASRTALGSSEADSRTRARAPASTTDTVWPGAMDSTSASASRRASSRRVGPSSSASIEPEASSTRIVWSPRVVGTRRYGWAMASVPASRASSTSQNVASARNRCHGTAAATDCRACCHRKVDETVTRGRRERRTYHRTSGPTSAAVSSPRGAPRFMPRRPGRGGR